MKVTRKALVTGATMLAMTAGAVPAYAAITADQPGTMQVVTPSVQGGVSFVKPDGGEGTDWTPLMGIVDSDGQLVSKVYCIESFVMTSPGQGGYLPVPTSSTGVKNWDLVNGVMLLSVPNKSMSDVNSVIPGMTEAEAVAATQLAIWHLTDGVNLKADGDTVNDGVAGSDADKRVNAGYAWLLEHAKPATGGYAWSDGSHQTLIAASSEGGYVPPVENPTPTPVPSEPTPTTPAPTPSTPEPEPTMTVPPGETPEPVVTYRAERKVPVIARTVVPAVYGARPHVVTRYTNPRVTVQVDTYRPKTQSQANVVAALDNDNWLTYREDKPLWGLSSWYFTTVARSEVDRYGSVNAALRARGIRVADNVTVARPGVVGKAWCLTGDATTAKPWGARLTANQADGDVCGVAKRQAYTVQDGVERYVVTPAHEVSRVTGYRTEVREGLSREQADVLRQQGWTVTESARELKIRQ